MKRYNPVCCTCVNTSENKSSVLTGSQQPEWGGPRFCNVNRSSPHFFHIFGAPFGRLFFSCHQTFLSTDNNNSHHPVSLCPSINNHTLDSIICLPNSFSSPAPTSTLPSSTSYSPTARMVYINGQKFAWYAKDLLVLFDFLSIHSYTHTNTADCFPCFLSPF